LAAYQSIVAEPQAESMSTQAILPESGSLLMTLHFRSQHAMKALVLEVGKPPTGQLLRFDGTTQKLRCSGEGPPIEAGPISVHMTRALNGWSAKVNDTLISCASDDGVGRPAMTSGLRRVSIESAKVDNRQPSTGSLKPVGIGAVVGALFAGLLVGFKRFMPSLVIATGISGCAGLLFIGMDGAQLAETLRLIESSEDLLPLVFSGFASAAAIAIGLSIKLARSKGIVGALIPSLAFALGTAAIWPVIGAMGWLYTVFAGLSLGALVWVNVHPTRIRYYNLSALSLACALLGSTEVMVRYTHMGSLWNAADVYRGAGSISTLIEQFEGMASGVPSIYPAKGFPVALPPKQAERRVVCLGASSTGGAFQNDSLDEFYPARMAQMQPGGTETVNQGVGGWTSFHIRQFLDGYADAIDGDVWTIYLGVNENLPTPLPFAALYEAWKEGALTDELPALDSIRLYQALRLLARSIKPGGGVGVPPESLRENLVHIVKLAKERDVKVLLMSEGVRPDPRILWHYSTVMEQVAESSGSHVVYLDTASILDGVGSRAFIDSNHLTDLGHRTVATAVSDELTRLGWW